MLILKIPTTTDAWKWLARFAYLRYFRRQEASGMKPVGIPGNRDPNNPCTAFEPRGKKTGDWGDCETDGHYLCGECCHRKQATDSP